MYVCKICKLVSKAKMLICHLFQIGLRRCLTLDKQSQAYIHCLQSITKMKQQEQCQVGDKLLQIQLVPSMVLNSRRAALRTSTIGQNHLISDSSQIIFSDFSQMPSDLSKIRHLRSLVLLRCISSETCALKLEV